MTQISGTPFLHVSGIFSRVITFTLSKVVGSGREGWHCGGSGASVDEGSRGLLRMAPWIRLPRQTAAWSGYGHRQPQPSATCIAGPDGSRSIPCGVLHFHGACALPPCVDLTERLTQSRSFACPTAADGMARALGLQGLLAHLQGTLAPRQLNGAALAALRARIKAAGARAWSDEALGRGVRLAREGADAEAEMHYVRVRMHGRRVSFYSSPGLGGFGAQEGGDGGPGGGRLPAGRQGPGSLMPGPPPC